MHEAVKILLSCLIETADLRSVVREDFLRKCHIFMFVKVLKNFNPLCSLFILSNETVNIWSHLLGFLLFFCVGVYNMALVLPAVGASREDYVIYSIGLFCFQVQDQFLSFPLL